MKLILTILILSTILISSLAIATSALALDRLRLTLEEPEAQETSFWRSLSNLMQRLQARSVGVISPDPGDTFKVTAVAYTSNVTQTDFTPCITAAGTRVRRGVVATNFLPLGTRLKINGEEYVVEDRMNSRYNGQYIIDIWHPSTAQAREFGKQKLTIEILGQTSLVKTTPTPEEDSEKIVMQEPRGILSSLRSFTSSLSRFAFLRAIGPDQDVDCSRIADNN